MADVEIRRAADDDTLKTTIYSMLTTGGVDRIARGRVLIKPNLLLAATPAQAVTTHPHVLQAVVPFVSDQGGDPIIADSPAVGRMSRIYRGGVYREALQDLDVPFQAFDTEAAVDIGPPFGPVPLARPALEADAVINLAKLKTHSQMTLSLGVKNTFSCVVGLKKPGCTCGPRSASGM